MKINRCVNHLKKITIRVGFRPGRLGLEAQVFSVLSELLWRCQNAALESLRRIGETIETGLRQLQQHCVAQMFGICLKTKPTTQPLQLTWGAWEDPINVRRVFEHQLVASSRSSLRRYKKGRQARNQQGSGQEPVTLDWKRSARTWL